MDSKQQTYMFIGNSEESKVQRITSSAERRQTLENQSPEKCWLRDSKQINHIRCSKSTILSAIIRGLSDLRGSLHAENIGWASLEF